MSMLMPTSPRGREITYLTGDAEGVSQRGTQIQELATAMSNSADVMDRLVNDGSDMAGEAIDKLRELSTDVYAELRRAAELYQAVGPHISAYGAQLEISQPAIVPIVDNLQTLWLAYRDAQDTADGFDFSRPDYPRGEDADDPDLREQAEEDFAEERGAAQASAAAARAAWDEEAGRYDTQWDSWYDAFEAAANGIREDSTDAITDSFDDDFRGFLETAASVLAVAGLVLAVLGLIIGGPIIAALAAIVAIAALIVTIVQMQYGDADGWDLAFAIVGVIPFGAIGKGSGLLGESMSFSDDFARWTGAGASSIGEWSQSMNAFRGMAGIDVASDIAAQVFSGRNVDDWAQVGTGALADVGTVASVWGTQAALVGDIVDLATGQTFEDFENVGDAVQDIFS